MAFQEFELNMIPHGDMPSFYASQYETGRPIIIDVLMGEDAFDCSELFIELHCRKVDDNIVTLEPDSVDGNQVTFVGTEQLFACPGKNLCEVCLYADETKDTSLGSLNFFIEVEPDPLAGGLTSETQIYDLYQQVEEITQQVIGDDYYDKDEVDALLDDKADKSDTYTKSQVDTALNLKADKSTTYTKTQVDNLLNDKADKATTYTKTQVDSALALKANSADLATVATTGDYDDLINKPTIPAAQVQSDWDQSDNTKVDYIKNKPDLSVYVTSDALGDLIYDLLPAGTASGAVANFETEVGGVPLVDCKAYIVAQQSAGTPTPSDPLPISGFTSCIVSVADENMSVQDTYSVSWQTEAGTVYGGNLDLTSGVLTVTHKAYKFENLEWTYNAGQTRFYTTISDDIILPISYTTVANIKCEVYETVKFTDVTGTATDNIIAGVYQTYNYITCRDTRYTDAPSFKTGLTGYKFICELATPVTYQLSATQVDALLGVNNIYNDVNGDTEVTYKDTIQHYIDSRV